MATSSEVSDQVTHNIGAYCDAIKAEHPDAAIDWDAMKSDMIAAAKSKVTEVTGL